MLEPMKRKLEWESDMSRMLNAVLTDYRKIRLTVENWKEGAARPLLDMAGFHYYWDNKRDLFYETLELQTLVALAQTLQLYEALAKAGALGDKEFIANVTNNIMEMKTLNLEPSGLKRLWWRINRRHRYRRGIQTSAWLKGKSTLQEFGPRDEQ